MSMTSAETGDPLTGLGLQEVVYDEGREALTNVLNRSMTALFGYHDPALNRTIASAIETFAMHDGDPQAAARQLAPQLSGLGARHARHGHGIDDLNVVFQRVHGAVARGLPFTLKPGALTDTRRYLRAKVAEYVENLRRHALLGWYRVNSDTQFCSVLSSHQPVDDTELDLARPSNAMWLHAVTQVDGLRLDPDGYRVVVATAESVSAALFEHADVLSAEDPREVLVPASWDDNAIDALNSGQAVVSTPTSIAELGDVSDLVHRGAGLLHSGVLTDQRRTVPCHDLLGLLVLHSSPQLCDMVVSKQLAGWETMTPIRRINIGEVLLAWLEHGQPINVISRRLDLAAQTAHSRMRSARALVGDALDDPLQRLELILALQTALPKWRAESA